MMKLGGLILAGGLGQRVASRNKGLLPLQGKPLVEYLISNLTPHVNYLAISANKELPQYQAYGLPVFTDLPELQEMGPLAGIASACRQFPEDLAAIQVVPCDTPFLPTDLLPKLATALFNDPQNEIAYAATKDCIHPSIFLFKPMINQHILEHIMAGKRSLKSWVFNHQSVEVFFTDEQAFTNINHLTTLAHFNEEQ